MQPNAPPPYKPSSEIRAAIEQQQLAQQKNSSGQRRRTAVLPKRSWIQRNPKLFQITFITTTLLVFFSKPLYDGFFGDQLPPTTNPVPAHKR